MFINEPSLYFSHTSRNVWNLLYFYLKHISDIPWCFLKRAFCNFLCYFIWPYSCFTQYMFHLSQSSLSCLSKSSYHSCSLCVCVCVFVFSSVSVMSSASDPWSKYVILRYTSGPQFRTVYVASSPTSPWWSRLTCHLNSCSLPKCKYFLFVYTLECTGVC